MRRRRNRTLSGVPRGRRTPGRDVGGASSRPAPTDLYKRAGYLITLTHAPSWEENFGPEAKALRQAGKDEFARTAKKINRGAAQIGTEADTQLEKRYRSAESKYKGGAHQAYVAYDLEQKTRSGGTAPTPRSSAST